MTYDIIILIMENGMNQQALKQYVLDNPKLVKMRPAGDGIYVLKYSKKVFFDDLWNEYLEECRGTIVDEDFNVISRPFTKIYNFGVEKKAPKIDDDTEVTAYRKVNGFMVAMTWYNDDILVSTTGSTDSSYVDMAKEMMLKHMSWDKWQTELLLSKGVTLMFECVHPNDPHIVVEDPGMYFIGYRENSWNSSVYMYGEDTIKWARTYALKNLNCYYAEGVQTTMGEVKQLAKECKHEGFVVYTLDDVSTKIKSPYYLTSKWVARNPRTDKLMTQGFKNNIDEEYYPLVDAIRENIDVYTAMSEQERLEFVRKFLG